MRNGGARGSHADCIWRRVFPPRRNQDAPSLLASPPSPPRLARRARRKCGLARARGPYLRGPLARRRRRSSARGDPGQAQPRRRADDVPRARLPAPHRRRRRDELRRRREDCGRGAEPGSEPRLRPRVRQLPADPEHVPRVRPRTRTRSGSATTQGSRTASPASVVFASKSPTPHSPPRRCHGRTPSETSSFR